MNDASYQWFELICIIAAPFFAIYIIWQIVSTIFLITKDQAEQYAERRKKDEK